MDPLSSTLAAVSSITTVEDVAGLGQKIYESFSMVSNTYRDAQHVAEDIKDMVQEIKVFCEYHEAAAADMRDFRVALHGLLGKFRSFEMFILPVLPHTGGRRRNFIIRGWDAWRNCSKVERSIINLLRNVVAIMRRYMINSTMRTETKLGTIHQETSGALTIMQSLITPGPDMLEAFRRGISALRGTAATAAVITVTVHGQYEAPTTDAFNRNIIVFAQSTPSASAPMLRTPIVITDELITAYIKFHVNIISTTLEKRSTFAIPAPNSDHKFQMAPILEHASMSVTHLRHHVVQQVTTICHFIETDHMKTISINEGVTSLSSLVVGLQKLQMGKESILVGNWAIRLARTLVDASDGEDPDRAAGLALALANQSLTYYDNDDKVQGLQAIEEAYTITRNLQEQYKGESHFQMLQTNVLSLYSRFVDNRRAIETSIEVVHIWEDILSIHAFTQSKSEEGAQRVENVATPSPSFLDRLFLSAAPKYVITQYAWALQRLGGYLSIVGDPQRALDLSRLAIAVHRNMVSVNGKEYKVHLANSLFQLVQGGTAMFIPPKELVNIAGECIQLLRELVAKYPLLYAPKLCNALSVRGRTLAILNQDDKAIATWEEVASIAEQILQNTKLRAVALFHLSRRFRHLKRFDDAARTLRLAITAHQDEDGAQAKKYSSLSRDLRELGRFMESVEPAQKAVTLYQRLVITDPGRRALDLTMALSHLASCLGASGDFSAALKTWKDAVSMLDNRLDPTTCVVPTVFKMYEATLAGHPIIGHSHVSPNEEECLEVCSTAVRYLGLLLAPFPQHENIVQNLFWAKFNYAYNLVRLGHLRTALQQLDNWFNTWSRSPEATLSFGIPRWHVVMAILKSNALDAQGYTEQALLTLETVQRIQGEIAIPTFQKIIESMAFEARLQVNLGNIKEALQLSEEALQLSRVIPRESGIDGVVPSLHAVALTTLSCFNYDRAADVARQGCDIYASSNWQFKSEHDIHLRPSLMAVLSSAEANLGRCDVALEDAYRAVDLSLEIRSMKSEISVTAAESSYMETRGNLAEILMATGEFVQAREICEERKIYFLKRVETRMGDYRELAPILRTIGILSCTEGRHDEGEDAVQELSRIMKMLGDALPSLQEQVKIRLRHQVKVPILKVLNDLSEKLTCGHQAGVSSLLEI